MNLAKTYEPQAYEGEIYELWERTGAFEPKGDGEHFALIMPPPNANAPLHIGTATFVKQDAKVRYERLKGKRTLYLPGADHAGFETWYVFEKELAKLGKSKFDFTNHELYKMTWDFVQDNMHLAKTSYRQMGLSCSWDNFTFTLDEKITKNVKVVFKKMWEEGLVYRGKRLVNFCTFHGTSFSDIEVDHEDKNTPLYHLKYGPFELVTTRPETIMGDTGVAFHPNDERYIQFEGQEIEIEGPEKSFKVRAVADELVDKEFGTGVVKVTPAHSFDDSEIAERHNLPYIEVIGKDGLMNENAGKYQGMTVLEAREAVVNDLKAKGLVIKVDETYQNRVGVCYKCHTVIEPLMMDQWFVSMKPLAEKAIEGIEADRVKFVPAKRKEIGLDYLKNIKDWNISRQCPWGIQIPAFYNEEIDEWIYSDSNEDEVTENGKTYIRDTDTFDTWMSSSQFPYLALGWPDGENFKEFFPTSWLHLGREIFTQWGLRMIMMSLYITGEVPFRTLYVNGNIRGEDGKKMSKSLGNNVAAKEILDEYGSDAMRMGMLMIDTTPSADKAYDPSKVVLGRNFTNKLWNVARFIENLLDEHKLKANEVDIAAPKSPADHWILGELDIAIDKADRALENDNFGEAINAVYDVIWNKFADWYIEASKRDLNLSVLTAALETALKLAHPFAPFVTEAIWQSLGFRGEDSMLVTETWPTRLEFNESLAGKFNLVIKATEFARKVKTYVGPEMEVSAEDDDLAELTKNLARLKSGSNLSSSLNIPGLEGWSLILSDESLVRYRNEIGRRVDELQAQIKNIEARLNNRAYIEKAPEKLVNESREVLASYKEELAELKSE
ncbi:MAG: valine--tRNA ligase [Candidatus Nomurabacteria bacterium]|nr:MAG: valine--tRNA ligase [Candidatus Nomurabacteria bacterium]